MSNLLKYNRVVVKDDDKLVIDTNKMVQDLISSRQTVNFGKQSDKPDADGFVCGLDAATVEQLIADEPEEETVDAGPLLEDAKAQAEEILENARKEAESILEEARTEGHRIGIEEGNKKAENDFRLKTEELEKKYADKEAELSAEYDRRYAEMEPEMVNVLLELFSKVTLTISEDKKDLVLLLIDRVLKNADANKDFVIRVSEEDYKFVCNNKNKIAESASPDSKIEISRDGTLSKNQCIIETEAGVFDCSLDIQLENLVGEIRLLSCLNSFKED